MAVFRAYQPESNSAKSAKSAKGGCSAVVFGIFWTLFSSIFLVVGIWAMVSDLTRSGWPSTPCEIEQFEITDSRSADPPFGIDTRYSYSWEGKSYTGTQPWAKAEGKDDYIDLTDALESYRANQLTECYVNPENPSEAFLFSSSNGIWFGIIFTLVGGFFVAIGIGITVSGRRSKKAEKQALSSQATSDKEAGKAIAIPFFGVFACVGLGMLFFWIGPMWQKYLSAQSWQEMPATVIWSTVRTHDGDDGDTYSADIFYQYTVNGELYKSNTVGLMGGSSSGRSGKQETVNAHPKGKTVTCYVDPDNPHNALLQRELGWWAAFSLFPLPFAGVGIGGIWFTLRKKKKALSSASTLRSAPQQKASYASPIRGNNAHQTFSPSKKRVLKTLGLLAFAAIWNGIVSLIYFSSDGAPVWFLAIFAIVGVVVLIAFFYQLLTCFNPAPRLTLLPSEIEIGSIALLKWSVSSGEQKLKNFAIYLVGEEEARYRRGTDTVTVAEIFYEQPLIDTSNPREIRTGTAEIALPLDTVPSWAGSNNAIKWSLRVRGDIPFWPDVSDDYAITVTTPKSHE